MKENAPMMLGCSFLAKRRLHVIGVDNNVLVWVGYAEIVQSSVNLLPDPAKSAYLLGTMCRGGHHINPGQFRIITLGGIKYLPVFLPRLFRDMLGSEEQVRNVTG
jgi:hypothetical protein